MDWSREKCLELIDRYERYPILWNPKHGLYYNKVKKIDAWTIIDENLGCAPGEAKKKMDSILASFRREKAKGKQSVGTGKARHEIYVSKWYAFPRLAFLLDRDEPRKTVDTVEEDNEPESEIEELDNDNEEAETVQDNDETVTQTPEMASQTVEIAMSAPQTSAERRSVTPRCKRKKPSDETTPKVDEALGILKSAVANNALKSDGCSIYGQHVAYKLRAYTNKTRNIVEHHINNILFNADMGHYDGTGSTSSNSRFSVYSLELARSPSFLSSPHHTPVPSPSRSSQTSVPSSFAQYPLSTSQTPVPTPSPKSHPTVTSITSYPASATHLPPCQAPSQCNATTQSYTLLTNVLPSQDNTLFSENQEESRGFTDW